MTEPAVTTVAQPQSVAPITTTAPTTTLPTQPTPTTVVEVPPVAASQESLVQRVAKFKPENTQTLPETNPFGLTKDVYEKVQSTPELAAIYKSMQADYTRKTQETADLRKKADEVLKQQPQAWTKERLQAELNKPDFIQAAQQIIPAQAPPNSGLTNEEYSALTDKEKAQLNGMQQTMQQLQLQNWQMQQRQQDEQLKSKYANYAPDIVDTTVSSLLTGQRQATREDLWKAIDYDNAIERAYKLGLQDKQQTNIEKQQALSVQGVTTTPQNEVPPINQGESNTAYFKRIANLRLAQVSGQRK